MQHVLHRLQAMSAESLADLQVYKERSSWLNEIWQFCQAWNGDESIDKWHGTEVIVVLLSTALSHEYGIQTSVKSEMLK